VLRSFTLSYNTMLNTFDTQCPYKPQMYMICDGQLISTGNLNRIECWLYGYGETGNFFGDYYPSSIAFVVNKHPEFSKIFNTLTFNMTVIGNLLGLDLPKTCFSQIRVYNEYQDTGYVDLVYDVNMKRINREWHIKLPRPTTETGLARVRSQTATIELVFDHNATDRSCNFILEDIMTGMTVR